MNSFRANVWDPSLIVGQIICMQSVYYFSFSMMLIFLKIGGYHSTIDDVFVAQVNSKTVLVQLLTSVVSGFALSLIIQRAKQCLDFAVTLHFWHLLFIVILCKKLPTQISWWLVQVLSITICTVLGEYICLKKETQEIILSSNSKYDF